MFQTKLKHFSQSLEYTWVRYENISDNLKLAIIASEDQKFPDHFGFDIESIKSAYFKNQNADSKRYGASTITQQTAKNLFLWPGKSYIRKGIEAYLSLLMELLWSKQRIYEVYLNIAQFDDVVFGVEAASQHYLKTSAASMSVGNASKLATLLPSPKSTNFLLPNASLRKKAQHIQRQMRQLGGTGYLDKL